MRKRKSKTKSSSSKNIKKLKEVEKIEETKPLCLTAGEVLSLENTQRRISDATKDLTIMNLAYKLQAANLKVKYGVKGQLSYHPLTGEIKQ